MQQKEDDIESLTEEKLESYGNGKPYSKQVGMQNKADAIKNNPNVRKSQANVNGAYCQN